MKITIYLVIIIVLSGCGISQNVKKGQNFEISPDEAIMVLGFDPEVRIHLVRGKLQGGVIDFPRLYTPEINIFPTNGYVIVKVKPTLYLKYLGIVSVFSGLKPFVPCSEVPVIQLDPGVINYVGHLSVGFSSGGRVSLKHTQKNRETADYLKANYGVKGVKLIANPMRFMEGNGIPGCKH